MKGRLEFVWNVRASACHLFSLVLLGVWDKKKVAKARGRQLVAGCRVQYVQCYVRS